MIFWFNDSNANAKGHESNTMLYLISKIKWIAHFHVSTGKLAQIFLQARLGCFIHFAIG